MVSFNNILKILDSDMLCCVFGHQSARCVQIMRWWCYNFRQGPIHTYSLLLITHFILTLLPHLYPPVFWIFSFSPSVLPPPTSSISSAFRCSPSLLHPLPTTSTGVKRRSPGLLELTIPGEPRNRISIPLTESIIQLPGTRTIPLSESGF